MGSIYAPYGLSETNGANGKSAYRLAWGTTNGTSASPLAVPTKPAALPFERYGMAPTELPSSLQPNNGRVQVLAERVEKLEDELRDLRHQLDLKEAAEKWYAAEALGDSLAAFILDRIVEADGIDVQVLNEKLESPVGWLALGLLWRGHLVEQYGNTFVATDLGRNSVERLQRLLRG